MSFKKTVKFTAAFAAAALTFALAGCLLPAAKVWAADAPKPVIQVGSTSLTSDDVLQILAGSTGGNPMMVGMMLAQSTLKDRIELANQIADAAVFAETAKSKGFELRPDVAFKIKWQTIQILVDSYLSDLGQKLDVSDKAMKKYYDGHKGEFVQAPASHARHILCGTEEEAKSVIAEIEKTKDFAKAAEKNSKDPNSAPGGGDLGWVENGTLDPAVGTVIETAPLNTVTGPVKSGYGWHVIEVLERRPQKQLSFDEAKDEVAQRMQRSFIDDQLKLARQKVEVKIDEQALDNLGGVKSPAEEPAPAAK